MGGGKIGPQADCALQVRDALRGLTQRAKQHAEQMPGIGVIGLPLQHLRIARLRCVKPALLMECQGLLEQHRHVGSRIYHGLLVCS